MELKLQKQYYQNKDIWILLIVPYGIETSLEYRNSLEETLLIVPYGIETFKQLDIYNLMKLTFNRTLWNWNFHCQGS